MDGLTEPEPQLSRACCASSNTYRPIGQFRVSGEFRSQSLACPSKPDAVRPTQLTSTGCGCSHQPQTIPVRSLMYRAPERLEPGLSPPGIQRSTNGATGRILPEIAELLQRVLLIHFLPSQNNWFRFCKLYRYMIFLSRGGGQLWKWLS